MPRNDTITPPSFNDFREGSQVFTETQDFSYEGITAAQSIIFDSAWTGLFGLSLVVSLILAVGIIYAMVRIRQIRKMEREHYDAMPPSSVARKVFGIEDASLAGSAHGARWRDVMFHVNSENQNDWRQAILEADIMLDDAITSRGYIGDGVGEKMKQVHRGDINTIDDAWDAHKVRNRIAHEGSNLDLNQREARRVIGLYENVFRELGYITG
ncbi:MAG: hypothetical protein JKX80_02605 [Candidatus Pacebacteria bacterium]|nr:hypothetical protein [Candidatus Paceibacterota bacterium]